MVVDKGAQEVKDNKNMLVFNLGELPMAFFVEKVVILEQPYLIFVIFYTGKIFGE